MREGQETANPSASTAPSSSSARWLLLAALAALCGAFFAQYNYRVDPRW
ncbi:MAG: hypothetical protein ACLUEQ_01310 [Cloacibacillus evryensis]